MRTDWRHEAYLGLDVGKGRHWACLVTKDGEVELNSTVLNREKDLDELFSKVGDALVVVDQVRNIGALAITRARIAGLDVAYLPGSAEHEAAKLFPGESKTDERDALVIAKTALGMPDALRPVPDIDEAMSAARLLNSQRDHLVTCSTRDKNRLRSVLLESCPAFEAAIDLSDPGHVKALEDLGGPWGIADAGKRSLGARTRGSDRESVDALWSALSESTRPADAQVEAENVVVRELARRIREAAEESAEITERTTALLSLTPTFACLMTVPGIGPRTAAELTVRIDISQFKDHDHLASYVGIAPRTKRSSTSINSVSASRQGSKSLKNLLIFSCNCLTRGNGRYAKYYRACRERGMKHNKALKAVARKRLKVIYAIMRDQVPYSA